MGTRQSSPEPPSALGASPALDTTTTTDTERSTPPNQVQSEDTVMKPKYRRKGFDWVQYKCRRRKAAYDKCYAEWYQHKFLSGKEMQCDECDDLFENWKECIMRGMLKERKKEGLGPPKEGSLLGEYILEEQE